MPNQLPRLALALIFATSALLGQSAQSQFGHSRARKLAEMGRLPQARDIVVRDLINYHRHRLPLPRADRSVALDLRFDRSSAAFDEEVVLQVGYTTHTLGDRSLAPPCSVALVVDCSGSMHQRGKLDQVRRGLRAFIETLRHDDQVAIVTFADESRVVTTLRRRGDGAWLQDAIAELHADGSTNLSAGLRAGIAQLTDTRHASRRVVLLTDGIANRGITDPDAILRQTTREHRAPIDVSTIGVGNNIDARLLQRLADGNRGLFHFAADERDVQKVFVREAESLLMPAARHVTLRLELPRSLTIEQICEDHAQIDIDNRRATVHLPDLNAGVTGVVLVRCRVAGRGGDEHAVRAELSFESARCDDTRCERGEVTLALTASGHQRTIDHEVRRNYAIAVLAEGLAAMAQDCDRQHWADAARSLQRARDRAARIFPGDDEDVQRVRDIAKGHANTLRRYVDRFRDF